MLNLNTNYVLIETIKDVNTAQNLNRKNNVIYKF